MAPPLQGSFVCHSQKAAFLTRPALQGRGLSWPRPLHASPVPMTLRCTVNTCGELDVSFRCEEPSLDCGGERKGIVPWQPSSAPEEAGRGGLKGRRNRKPLFLRRDWAMRLRRRAQGCGGIRGGPRRRSASSPAGLRRGRQLLWFRC